MNRDSSLGFAYLRQSSADFAPRTPASALKAVQEGLLPEAAFIFKAVNIRPIFEEPYDIMEIERLLARPNLELDTALLLMRIFGKLIRDPDKELALFAAESINALEVRYTQRIQSLKKNLEKGPDQGLARRLVKNLFELGMLSFDRPVLKNFYLAEAHQSFETGWSGRQTGVKDIELLIRIVLERGLPATAETILTGFLATRPEEPSLLYLMAQVQFIKKDYLRVISILARLNQGNLLPKVKAVYNFWMSGSTDE